ncbi:MAG: DUF72 domain-containing protein [Bryobacterales bacterium]|nr:DUF72 domain-containing protein [Bryobacterales bacterium]MBV9401034.1 DUF72 domain-containing protein [Bryobacterales bacterium]
MSSLYIGTAGWAYPHWNGVVYPKTSGAGRHPLDIIAKYLDAVEVNSSFYQFLRPELVRLWLKKVEANPRFLFTAKLHQRFTHARILDPKEISSFKDGLIPLLGAKRLGAVLLQFPWSFRFTAENRDFLIRLRREFHEFPLVAEMRHDSWMAEEGIGTFLDYRIGFCNIDQPEYTRAMPPPSFLTSGIGYVRLHGRNPRNALGAFDRGAVRSKQHDYLYSEPELGEWARRIEQVQRFAERTVVIFNNDAGGKSFVNALQLRALVTGVRGSAPKDLRRRYPVELSEFGPAYAEQQCLFPAA